MSINIGAFLGSLIVICYVLTVLNFVVKVVNKKFGKSMSRYPALKKNYGLFMKFIIKNHKLFGFLTILFVLAHTIVQYSKYGLNVTGAVAASAMVLQILLGVYGAYINKKRSGLWFILHRLVAVVLIVVIGIHIV